jgi:hypothetical protein
VLIHRFAICFLNSSNLYVIFAHFLYPQIAFLFFVLPGDKIVAMVLVWVPL